ncbi:TolC family protein [Pelodictyon luteolum]|uniref:Outer membrane protein-like protein n=1 Tax=Chlorobium luteolum (strain DSM 273 / BCRC 81028 / 2530) TaxID=319225 RepID=Q3B5X5_CHLL3|nr:TolC family protein [Pelodictyon luteolum]ABB23256.1 Outer membrane protein-like protein [Pelodictyon luteolum DSM 273]
MMVNPLRHAPMAFLAAVLLLLSSCAVVPKPLDSESNRARLSAGLAETYARQEQLQRSVTLEEAMARAISYNLDSRVRLMQEALAHGELARARWDMLPKLAASAGYSHRSDYPASSSASYSDGEVGAVTLSMSTSQDRDLRTADLSVAWNVLDFGVSYFQAKQQADRQLIWRERRRKSVHNLMQEVRLAYWQAAGAARLRSRAMRVLDASERELGRIRRQRELRLTSGLESLRQEKALLEVMRQMQAILDEFAVAKPRLASLMGLPPGSAFELALVDLPDDGLPGMDVPVEEMERVALKYRPELREAAYEERISALEARKAIARLLPGIELSGSKEYNSNSFAAYPNWWGGGMTVSWNLMNIPSAPQRIKTAKAAKTVAEANSLALAMAVLSQVYVSRQQQIAAIRQYSLARQQWDVDEQMLWYVEAGHSLNALSDRELIQTEANAVKAQLGLYVAYASMERAQGNVYASLGLDPFVDIDARMPVDKLADTIKRASDAWQAGKFSWINEEMGRIEQSRALYHEGMELFRREEYARADSTFSALRALDPFNESARQYAEVLIPARVKRIDKAQSLRHKAMEAQKLQQEGKVEEAKALWTEIITESKEELSK